MSHIATALAKSKGKDVRPAAGSVTNVPALRVGPVGDSPMLKSTGPTAVAPARGSASVAPLTTGAPAVTHRPKRNNFIAGGWLLVVGGGVAVWLLLGGVNPFAKFSTPPPPPALTQPKIAPVTIVPARMLPSDALAAQVRLLAITAAAGGSSQRLSVGGKVYEPGETVVDGLILQSIENAEIVFRDADGNLYTRRL